jgi:GNAT superfamily N-acetyltransferase
MARRIVRLTRDTLAELPESARSCLFWELDPVARRRAERAGEAAAEKAAWVSRVLLEWGSCGRVLLVDGRPAGFVLYAPPAYLPGSASLPTAPVGEDAVQLATMYVHPEQRGAGFGRLLMQAMAGDLLRRGGLRAVEAFGRAGRGEPCVLPADFLLRVGFTTQRPHPRYPRMRLELRSALTWREELEVALDRLLGVVRPVQVRPSHGGRALRQAQRPPVEAPDRRRAQPMNSASSLRITDLGRAPTICLTTSPPE